MSSKATSNRGDPATFAPEQVAEVDPEWVWGVPDTLNDPS